MAYAQISYKQILGSGPDTIASAGCFLTAFSNLLLDYGLSVDPPTLDTFFQSHKDFIGSEELTWASVSKYDQNVTTTSINGAGWPSSNEAIVEFRYGNGITHFCKVQDHTARTILDSWDGKIKVSPYGNPVASATYTAITSAPPAVYAPAPTEKLLTVTGAQGMYVRTSPHVLKTNIYELLPKGTTVNYVKVVTGDSVGGNTTWLESVQGHYYWSGNVNYKA